MTLTGESEVLGEKLVQVSLCPPQIPHVHFSACSYVHHRSSNTFHKTYLRQLPACNGVTQKPTVVQPLNKFHSFYGTQGVRYSFHKSPILMCIRNHITSMPHSHNQFETLINIMLLNSQRCIKLVPSIQVYRVKCFYVCLDIFIHDLITFIIFSANYRSCIFSLYSVRTVPD